MKATAGHLTGDKGNVHYSKFLDSTIPGRLSCRQYFSLQLEPLPFVVHFWFFCMH